jgi:hypothetical protein
MTGLGEDSHCRRTSSPPDAAAPDDLARFGAHGGALQRLLRARASPLGFGVRNDRPHQGFVNVDLYSITTNQAAIAAFFRIRWGLPPSGAAPFDGRLHLRSISAARGRSNLLSGLLFAVFSLALTWLEKHGFSWLHFG